MRKRGVFEEGDMYQNQAGQALIDDPAGLPDGLDLPCSIDAEKTVLGSMLTGADAADAAIDLLQVDDFHYGAHRKIFMCMRELRRRGEAVDTLTLCEALRGKAWLRETGEEVYIAELAECVGVVGNLPHHAAIVRRMAGRRRVDELGKMLSRDACSGECDLDGLLLAARENIERIAGGPASFPRPVWGDDYLTTGVPPRKPELIAGILRRSHKMLIGAPSKACKSFLAIRLAVAIAEGRDWLGFPCAQSRVCVVNFEVDEGSYMHRVKAVASAMGVPETPGGICFQHLRGRTGDIETLLPAIARAIKGRDTAAVILDPQYKLLRSTIPQFQRERCGLHVIPVRQA